MNKMFYHKVCGNAVSIDLKEHFRITTNFAPGINVMVATRGDITCEEEVSPANYYCLYCKKEIKVEEIFYRCMECGEEFKMIELYRGRPGGIIVCTKCKENYEGKEFKSLAKVAAKISTKNV